MIDRRDPLRDALLDLEASAPAGPPPALHRDRRPWIVAGGLVATAAVIAGFLIGTGVLELDRSVGQATPSPTALLATPTESPTAVPSDSSSPSLAPSPTATEAPAPTPTPPPTESPRPTEAPSGWREMPFPVSDNGAIGPMYFDDELGLWMMVEYGRDFEEEGMASIPVLSSQNGSEWTVRGSLPVDAVDPTAFLRIGPIVRFGGELYISATENTFDNSSYASSPMAWTSADGIEWRRAPTEMPVGGFGTAEVIASTGDRLLAEVGESDGGHVWTSTDGLAWTEADVPSNGRPMGVTAAHADEDGFVLAGHVLETEHTWVPAIWASPDGIEWTRASSLGEGGGRVTSVTRGPGGSYLAAVYLHDTPTQLMSSPDRVTWSTMTTIGQPPESGPSDLHASPQGAIYIGQHDGRFHVLSWTGGATWHELATPPVRSTPGYAYYDVSVGAGKWVAVGTQAGTDQPDIEILAPILLVGDFTE